MTSAINGRTAALISASSRRREIAISSTSLRDRVVAVNVHEFGVSTASRPRHAPAAEKIQTDRLVCFEQQVGGSWIKFDAAYALDPAVAYKHNPVYRFALAKQHVALFIYREACRVVQALKQGRLDIALCEILKIIQCEGETVVSIITVEQPCRTLAVFSKGGSPGG